MNQSNQFDALFIEKYLDNELSAHEKQLLETELKQNPLLFKEFRLRSEVNKMLSDAPLMDLIDKLEAIHKEQIISKDFRMKVFKPVVSIKRVWYAYAASFLLLAASLSYFLVPKSFTNQELYDKYVNPYEIASSVRSSDTQANETLIKALEKYEQKDYERAITLFEKVLATDSMNLSSNFYSGISYMQNKKYDPADKSFNRVIRHNDNPYIEHAEWYLGFCYLMSDRKDKAIAQFQRIAESNSFYRDKAKHLLRDLR